MDSSASLTEQRFSDGVIMLRSSSLALEKHRGIAIITPRHFAAGFFDPDHVSESFDMFISAKIDLNQGTFSGKTIRKPVVCRHAASITAKVS